MEAKFGHFHPYRFNDKTLKEIEQAQSRLRRWREKFQYMPFEEDPKPEEPEPIIQREYKVIRFINPLQEKINAQQNFKIAQVESHLKEHLDKSSPKDIF